MLMNLLLDRCTTAKLRFRCRHLVLGLLLVLAACAHEDYKSTSSKHEDYTLLGALKLDTATVPSRDA
jgi:hypothetical protein